MDGLETLELLTDLPNFLDSIKPSCIASILQAGTAKWPPRKAAPIIADAA
jgi:hypothetical protein